MNMWKILIPDACLCFYGRTSLVCKMFTFLPVYGARMHIKCVDQGIACRCYWNCISWDAILAIWCNTLVALQASWRVLSTATCSSQRLGQSLWRSQRRGKMCVWKASNQFSRMPSQVSTVCLRAEKHPEHCSSFLQRIRDNLGTPFQGKRAGEESEQEASTWVCMRSFGLAPDAL